MVDSVVTGTDNREVYEHAGRDLVLFVPSSGVAHILTRDRAALDGYDAVIFAYGQTASGKTFTVSGTASNPGIIPQAISEIFQFIRSVRGQVACTQRADQTLSIRRRSSCYARRTSKFTMRRSRICSSPTTAP